MDRRIPFCGVAALICLLLSELAEDSFRGIALFFAGVYALYTLLFTLDDLSRRRAAPTPTIEPVTVWVVETGMPVWDA